MGGKIPNTIRRQVIIQWLYGFSRDQIAKDNQIGAGTVSTIIKQCKEQKQKEYAADDSRIIIGLEKYNEKDKLSFLVFC